MTEENAGTLLRLAESVATFSGLMGALNKRMDNEFKHMADDISTLTQDFKTFQGRMLGLLLSIVVLLISSIVGLACAIIKMQLLPQ